MAERVDRLLGSFDSVHRVQRIGAIARRSGLAAPTASRIVAQLVALGWLERDEEGAVRLGLRLWELGQWAEPVRRFREAGLAALHGVHAVVRQHAHLSVLDKGEVVVLERLSAPGAVVNYSVQGGRLPAHASAPGVVLLAFDEQAAKEACSKPLEGFTGETVTRPEDLKAILTTVRRERAIALHGHLSPSASGVAAVVLRPDGTAWGAIGVVVPNDGHASRWIPVVQAAARSTEMTHSGAPEAVWDARRRAFRFPDSRLLNE